MIRLAVLALFIGFVITVMSPASVSSQAADSDRQTTIVRMKQCRLFLKSAKEYVAEGAYDSALIVLDSVLACDPKNPDGFFRKGQIHLYTGDTAAAVATFASGVERAPMSSRMKLALARLKLIAGATEEASSLIDNVLAIKPRQSEALYLRGMCSLASGDSTVAIERFQKALDLTFARDKK